MEYLDRTITVHLTDEQYRLIRFVATKTGISISRLARLVLVRSAKRRLADRGWHVPPYSRWSRN